MLPKLKVLFLCTGNSCRSQMAEGWTRRLKGDRIQPFSAGVAPSRIDPRAVRAMSEAGVDISSQSSKHVDDLGELEFDFVVTVCDHARESCPAIPGGHRTLHAPFDDPPHLASNAVSDEDAMSHYRRVRDEIRAWAGRLPEALDSSSFEPLPDHDSETDLQQGDNS